MVTQGHVAIECYPGFVNYDCSRSSAMLDNSICQPQTIIKKPVKVCFYIARYPPTGRPVRSDTNLTPLGSIQPHSNYCADTMHSHLYSSVNWGLVERTKMPNLPNSREGDSDPGSLD